MGKRSFFLSYKKKKKRDDFLLPKSSLFFLKPWMNEQKISRILFVHPLKICEQYGFIQSIFGSIIPKNIKTAPVIQGLDNRGCFYKFSQGLLSNYRPYIELKLFQCPIFLYFIFLITQQILPIMRDSIIHPSNIVIKKIKIASARLSKSKKLDLRS